MGKYQIIYADPPWSYRSGKVNGAAQNHYPTMSDEQLYQLPVSTLAADTCVLFLWCTFPKLPEALKLIKAWGFTFKTVAFVWLKQNKSGNGFFLGLGWWTRSNAEICLLAVKGKPQRKAPVSGSLFLHLLSNIARNLTLLGIVFWNSWAICRALSCLPVKPHPDGMCGATK